MLTIFVYRPSLLTAQQRILEKVAEDRTAFFAMCYGTAKTTCLIDMQHAELLNAETAQEQILNQRQLVSAITVQFLQQITDTPGVYYRIFKELAWANVNVVELLSSGDELTLVFENAVIDRAFSVLKQCVQP
jgi:aspartokinase